MQNMLGVRERVMEHGRKFCLDAVIFAKALDIFKFVLYATQEVP